MDILNWKILNNSVVFRNTKKLFFNRYLYRAKFMAHNVRIALSSDNTMEVQEKYNSYISRLSRLYTQLDGFSRDHKNSFKKITKNTDITQLIEWHIFLANNDLKYRIEDPYISLYTNDINELYKEIKNNSCILKGLSEISAPKSEQAKKSLMENKVLVSRIKGFSHIVYLSDNWTLDVGDRDKVLAHLKTYGDDVRIPASTEKALMNKWCSGGYFYCNDPGITTFISLICPGIVKNIFELEVIT